MKVIAVGSGAALKMGANGDADVVLSHAPAAETKLVETGDLVEGVLVKHNAYMTTPVYISMDIDARDPACAPGVSHREPGGLSVRQVIDLIHTADQPIVAADIVEYNPRCDISPI